MNVDAVVKLVEDRSIPVREVSSRVTSALHGLGSDGISLALDIVRQSRGHPAVSYATDYLSLLGGETAAKDEAFRLILAGPPKGYRDAAAVTRHVSTTLLEEIAERRATDKNAADALESVIFEMAAYRPEVLRPYRARIPDEEVQDGVLSGGPNEWADDFVEKFRQKPMDKYLVSLGRFHTSGAIARLRDLRPALKRKQVVTWEAALEWAGELPGGGPSILGQSLEGFIVEPTKSPHAIGGAWCGRVPACPACDAPAGRAITLDASALPLTLPPGMNPTFFWYNCQCDSLAFTTVQWSGDEATVLFGPFADTTVEDRNFPAACALHVETHPNPTGVSVDFPAGMSRHQVGGPPTRQELEPLPNCPLCKRPMPLLVKLDSGMTFLGCTRYEGALHGFWCGGCGVATMTRVRV